MSETVPLPWRHLAGSHFLHRAGIRVHTDPADADAILEIDVHADHENGRGGVQGGMLASLVDAAAGFAVGKTVSPGQSYATRDLTIHYLANANNGPICAVVRSRRATGRTAVLQVDVVDAQDHLCAVATVTFAVFD